MQNYTDTFQINRPDIETPPLWVATPSGLAAVQAELANVVTLAVDTESDSLYSYFEKVCLLQFSTHVADYVVDPLALPDIAALGPILANPQVEKVFHAAEYDILCLKRDYEFTFENLFDTMIAARILGWPNVGLGNILQERFGVALNKKMQRADWGHRPLTAEQIAYAREDTHYLLALRDLQIRELENMGRLEEAREEFERLTRVEPTPRRFDPDGYWNLDGARDLDPVQLGVLRELFHFRDVQARKEDHPPFRVLSDTTLFRISSHHPNSLRELGRIAGVSSYVAQRYGQPILQAIGRGRAAPQTTPPHPRARREAPLDNSARARLGRLKDWRKHRAEARGVAPDVIVSNDVLFAAARKNPRTLETLIAASDLGPWKAKEYGEELLNVLHPKA
ncbi:MAG: HRDC domain-containing protein [Chloroflexi bacterium]|nr:HRDC domain-containing protein [Chloroflexota bacterium]